MKRETIFPRPPASYGQPFVCFVCLFVCLPGGINLGVLHRSSASLAALPGEASPTRAYLGTIVEHENGNSGIKGYVDSVSK